MFWFQASQRPFHKQEKEKRFLKGENNIDSCLHLVTYKGDSKIWWLFPACAPNMFIERFLNLLYAFFSAAPLSKTF